MCYILNRFIGWYSFQEELSKMKLVHAYSFFYADCMKTVKICYNGSLCDLCDLSFLKQYTHTLWFWSVGRELWEEWVEKWHNSQVLIKRNGAETQPLVKSDGDNIPRVFLNRRNELGQLEEAVKPGEVCLDLDPFATQLEHCDIILMCTLYFFDLAPSAPRSWSCCSI